MGESEIQVILVELQHVRDEIADIKEELKGKCTTCLNAGLAEQAIVNLEKLTNSDSKKLWLNVNAQWMVFGAVAAALFGSFVSHALGK